MKHSKLGMVIVTLATLLFAVAPSGHVPALMRFFQGLGAAMSVTTGAPLLLEPFPPAERGKILVFDVAVLYLGLAAGPFAGDLITQYPVWRSICFSIHFRHFGCNPDSSETEI